MSTNGEGYEGGCTCGEVRYRMLDNPLFVHCCHCSWCQRETGTAFATNAMIEAHKIQNLKGNPIAHDTPSNSGKGQKIWRCAQCNVAVWSNYSGAGEKVHFLRVGTLDQPDLFPPDIHIFTTTKQPWVSLPESVPAFPEFYDRRKLWPRTSLARLASLKSA